MRPNIVYLLADDLGYGDLGSYGQKLIRTTRLDQMAREGMRYSDGTEELYDMQTDPNQFTNVAPQFAEPLATLRRELDGWMKTQRHEGQATKKNSKKTQVKQ